MKGFFIFSFLSTFSNPLPVTALQVSIIAGTAIEIGLAHQKYSIMLFIILLIAGITGFAIFYQAIKFFEKI